MRLTLTFLLLFASVVISPAGAAVTVAFVGPDGYTDMGQFGGEAAAAMQEIDAHLKYLGERYLLPGQNLKIEVVDIDLAGRRPFSLRLNPNTRILEGKADWPSIKLSYVLDSRGGVLDYRHENIADLGYLRHNKGRYAAQSFPYEKRMLEEWFAQRFAKDRPAKN